MPATLANHERAGAATRMAAVAILAALSILPILVMLSTSLKTQRQIFSGNFSFFMVPTFENYRSVLEGRFLGYLGNSIVVSLIATALTLIFGTMCAYAISRFKFSGRSPIAIS